MLFKEKLKYDIKKMYKKMLIISKNWSSRTMPVYIICKSRSKEHSTESSVWLGFINLILLSFSKVFTTEMQV